MIRPFTYLVFVSIVCIVSNLVAQDPTSDWDIFEYKAIALENPNVREELELSDSQAKTIKGRYIKSLSKLKFLKTVKLRKCEKDSADYQAIVAEGNEMVAEARNEFGEIALDFQQNRLSQIARQFLHFDKNGLYIKSISEEFKLRDPQKTGLAEVNKSFVVELKELQKEYSKKLLRVVKRNMNDMKKELTANQKKEFEEYFGDPFFPAFQKHLIK